MDNRELGLQVLFNRVKDNRLALGVKTFRRSPTTAVTEEELLCVFMLEGIDRIMKPNSRNWLGYPARRELEVGFELINVDTFDIRAFYSRFRAVVLSTPTLAPEVMVREIRAVGPTSYRTPNIIGMQMVLLMNYIDNGN
jgi:hypothetical protein